MAKKQISQKQLAALSKEDKLKLLDLLDRKQELKREAKEAFVPHEGQLEIIKDKHEKRILVCGNGFGKTALGVNEAKFAVDGFNPITKEYTAVPANVVVVLDAPQKVADVWLPEMKKWMNLTEDMLFKDGKPYYSRVSFPNGSQLKFMFHLQEELAFESIESDFVVFDEPPPRSVWVALLRSGRKKGRPPRFLILGTPIAQPWLREFYAEWAKGNYPDTIFFKMSTKMNEGNLSKGYIESFSAHLTERERATRIDGEFFNSDGLALAGLWKRDKHLILEEKLPINYKQDWPHVIALDPHPNKPTYACMLAAAPDGKRYYVGEVALKKIPREFAGWLKQNWLITHNVIDIVCDNSGNADYTGGEGFKSFIEVLTNAGVRVRATSYDEKKDDEFMTRLQEGLFIPEGGEPKLQFLVGLNGIVRDIENVQWKALKGSEEYQPKLEIGNKDFLACLKYALAANLTYSNSHRKPLVMVKQSPWAGKRPRGSGYMERRLAAKRDNSDD